MAGRPVNRVLPYGRAALLVLCAAHRTYAEVPPLTHEVQKYTLLDPASAAIDIFVSSPQPITAAKTTIVQIKGPLGESIAGDTLAPAAPATIDSGGQAIHVAVAKPAAFGRPGDYIAVLRVTGSQNNTAFAQLVTLTLTVPAPHVDFTRDQNTIVHLVRGAPWSDAHGEATLRVQETSNRAAVRDLQVTSDTLLINGTNEVAPGQIAPQVVSAGGVAIPAGRHGVITLRLSGFARAGTINAALLLSSPSFDISQRLPFRVQVDDWWLVPLLVVTAGVMLGAWLRHLSTVRRPAELLRFRRTVLAAEIARWRERSRDPRQLQELSRLEQLLHEAELKAELNDAAAAGARLDTVDAGIVAFRDAWEARMKAISDQLVQMTGRTQTLAPRVRAGGVQADIARLDTAVGQLRDAGNLLETYQMLQAEAAIAGAVASLDALERAYPAPASAPPRLGMAPSAPPAPGRAVGGPIAPPPLQQAILIQKQVLARITWALTAVSVAIAVVTGMWVLYIGHSFGAPQDYLAAFLWGFGIDNSVKTIADVLKKF